MIVRAVKRVQFLNVHRPGFFEPSLTWGLGGLRKPPLCNLKIVNAMVTKLTQDDVDNNSSNFRCFVGIVT